MSFFFVIDCATYCIEKNFIASAVTRDIRMKAYTKSLNTLLYFYNHNSVLKFTCVGINVFETVIVIWFANLTTKL